MVTAGLKLKRLELKEGMTQKNFVPSSSTEVELLVVMVSEWELTPWP